MELSLAEQLLLLSYDDVSGKPSIPTANLDFGLAAAHLLDLSYAGKLAVENKKLVPIDSTHPDPDLVKIRAQKPHSADWWVYHLSSSQRRQEMLDRLVAAGMLERREHKVLGMFPVRAYPEVDPAQEKALADHLREVVIGSAEPDRDSAGLLALANACGLARHLFPDLDAKVVRHRINELTQGEWCGPAVRKTITAVDVAVLAAVSGGIVSTEVAVAAS